MGGGLSSFCTGEKSRLHRRELLCVRVCVSVAGRATDFDFGEEETCVEDLICEAVNMTITICLQRN